MADPSTILLVDDEESVQKLLTYPLERDGFRVVHAWDGEEALAKFAAEDVALSDAMNAYWTAFAKTGAPGSAGGPAWPKFDLAKEGQIEFGADGPQVREHFLKPWRDFVEAGVGK